MGADDVRLICYFNGNLIDEDRDVKYIGGIRKGDKVPKSIGFASFKEKIREMMNQPINGMEFKIKCGLRLDELTVSIDVDDEKSLRFVMDDSTFVRAYIQHVPHATTSNAAQREEMMFPLEAISNGACNENHENEAIPPKVKFDDICGAEAIHVEDMPDRVDLSQLTMENLVPPSAPIQDVNEQISEAILNRLEDTHHRFSQSTVYHQDEGLDYLISNQEDHGHNEVNMQADMLYVDNQFTSQMEETAPPPGWIQTSERESAQIGLSDIVFNFEREFENIEAFRNSLSDWAMETGRAYRTVRKTLSKLR
ncbi:hypothetical protein ACHQM5_007534 [Ranunculus cassubicifolius]